MRDRKGDDGVLTQAGSPRALGSGSCSLTSSAGSNPGVSLDSVSCASAANCSAFGSYVDSSGNNQGLLLSSPAAPDLAITNSGSPNPVLSGQHLTYTIGVSNIGGSVASSVSITDPLPSTGVFVSMSTTQGTCTRTASGPNKNKGGTVTCRVGTLGAGNSATITIVITATKPGTLSSTATVTATNVGDSPDADDTATAITTVTGT